MRFHELTPILNASVSPVILISGVGLLLLSMTNRLGRVIDRARQLEDVFSRASQSDRGRLQTEVRILFRRAGLLRRAITFATLSVLGVAVLVVALFVAAFSGMELVWSIAFLFVGCLLALIVAVVTFLQDIYLSLVALKLELGPALEVGDQTTGAGR